MIQQYMLSKIYQKDWKHINLLTQLLRKFTYNLEKENIKEIYRMIKNNESDRKIINYISKSLKIKKENTENGEDKSYDSEKRANRISDILSIFFSIVQKNNNNYFKYFNENLSNIKYLDVGSNTGTITVKFAKKIGLNSNNVFGIDVKSFTSQEIVPVNEFNFQYYDGINIPFENNYFDLVTCFMVIHHVEKLSNFLKELNRVTKIGGLLYIKEHDTYSEYIEWLVYLEHLFYDVKDYHIDYQYFVDNYYQLTFPKQTLQYLLLEYGFQLIETANPEFIKKHHRNNYAQVYYSIFVKISDN